MRNGQCTIPPPKNLAKIAALAVNVVLLWRSQWPVSEISGLILCDCSETLPLALPDAENFAFVTAQ
jgi:hypothetical protein